MTRPLRQGDAVIAVWKRYGRVGGTTHCAHLFEGTRQLCPQRHGLYDWMSAEQKAKLPGVHPVEIHASGLPFGHVCPRCRKVWEARRREAEIASLEATSQRKSRG